MICVCGRVIAVRRSTEASPAGARRSTPVRERPREHILMRTTSVVDGRQSRTEGTGREMTLG